MLAWCSGVHLVQLTTQDVWVPDVRIVNTVDQTLLLDGTGTVTIYDDGYVDTKLNVWVDAYCPMDLTLYPYDQQVSVCFPSLSTAPSPAVLSLDPVFSNIICVFFFCVPGLICGFHHFW